jgi:hypothetical protein
VVLAAGATLVAGIVVAIVVLAGIGSGHGSAVDQGSLQVSVEAPPPPPRGALVLAAGSGRRAVALAVGQGTRPRLTATVLASTGEPLSGLSLSFRAGGRTLESRSCGHGCYSAVAPKTRLRRVEVLVPGRRALAFLLPASPAPAARIVSRAARVIRSLRSIVYVETLRSRPGGALVTTWRLAAPNRVTYQIRGGASAVVIGTKRWDRDRPGARWRRSQQIPPLSVPEPSWGDVAKNAYLLGTSSVGDRPVWIVSFANPTTPAWFTAWIDRRTDRTLRLRMTAAAHFMVHRYLAFNRALDIRAPSNGSS